MKPRTCESAWMLPENAKSFKGTALNIAFDTAPDLRRVQEKILADG